METKILHEPNKYLIPFEIMHYDILEVMQDLTPIVWKVDKSAPFWFPNDIY